MLSLHRRVYRQVPTLQTNSRRKSSAVCRHSTPNSILNWRVSVGPASRWLPRTAATNEGPASQGTDLYSGQKDYVDVQGAEITPHLENAMHHISNGHAKPAAGRENGHLIPQSAPVDPSVQHALEEAATALAAAATSLETIPELDSADPSNLAPLEPPSKLEQLLGIAKQVVPVILLTCLAVVSNGMGLLGQWIGATMGGAVMAYTAYRKSSLALSGAYAAFAVGTATLGCSLRFGCTMLAFFISSSLLTQYKEELKQGLDDASKKGGQRTWLQVFANGGVPTMLAVAYGLLAGCVDLPLGPSPHLEPWRAEVLTMLMGGVLGYYACCNGDTWASELGPLSTTTPRLVTTGRPVRKGTNGGVTTLGLSASAAGGCLVGIMFWLAGIISPTLWIFPLQREFAIAQVQLIPLGLVAGLFGSLLDSLLGATLQFTGYDRKRRIIVSKPGPDVTHIAGLPFLSNNMVNFLSATITAVLTALLARRLFL